MFYNKYIEIIDIYDDRFVKKYYIESMEETLDEEYSYIIKSKIKRCKEIKPY